MKIIFKIAKAELRNLFYSPVAWFLAIAFLVQNAICYTYALLPIAQQQEVELSNNPHWKDFGGSMTGSIFFRPDSFISSVLQNLYLFIPLLTMGVISRETNNGTIRLLYSSPVKARQIVLGKYLAIMVYNFLLLLIFGFFIVSGFFQIKSLNYPLLLSAEVGFYLLVCAYTAIGVFMSSLTSYQIISAIGSFLIVFILSKIGGLWQQYDVVRDLTYFLSIEGRTDHMLRGLITSKDVLYFVVIVYIFLGFTLIRLRAGRESKPWWVRAGRYGMVLASALTIGYISSRPMLTGYWDVTPDNGNTLHPNIQQVVRELGKDPLEVTLYVNLLGPGLSEGLPQGRNVYLRDLWEPYLRFKPDIDFHYVYYYALRKGDTSLYRDYPKKTLPEIATLLAEAWETWPSLYKSPEEMRRIIDPALLDYRLVMGLKYRGRTEFLHAIYRGQTWPGDMQVAAAFKRLAQARIPKVYFVTGDLERNIHKIGEREYENYTVDKSYAASLVNIGFDVDTISLDQREAPADAEILVLADPKTQLSDTTKARLSRYVSGGGNMFILGEPGKQEMLNPLLHELGVQLRSGTIVEPTQQEMPHMVKPYATEATMDLTPGFLGDLKAARAAKNYEDSFTLLMPGVTGVSVDTGGAFKNTGTGFADAGTAFTVKPLMKTLGERTWLRQGTLITDSAEIVFDHSAGDMKGPFSTAVALTRMVNHRQQRIIVCGDADFLSNSRYVRGEGLITALYSWLDDNKFPIYSPYYYKAKDTKLLITAATANLLIIAYVWVLPGLILLFGALLLIRRKRK